MSAGWAEVGQAAKCWDPENTRGGWTVVEEGGHAARWFGGCLSDGITIKRGLAPSSLMCSSLAREWGFLLLSLRTEDVGEQNWNLGPCAA